MGTPFDTQPRLSVVVRSFNRLGALAELLTALLAQDHDSFEVVVIEQSVVRPPDEAARVDAIATDPRVRILRHPPLGGPRARNTGVRAARGQLLVFIDDDDLPASTAWLRHHERNFGDPKCLGVTGQFVEDGKPYVNLERARRQVLSFNVLKWQRVFAKTDVKKRVDSLMGGNAAIPRTTLERFGLWDECTPIEDEPSLAFRIGAEKADDEYLLFDPDAKMIRRLDVPGGMAKRTMSWPVYGKRVFTYLHNVLAHYHPLRFALLYPIYWYMVTYHCVQWVCSDSKLHQTLPRRIFATACIIVFILPCWTVWLAGWWFRRMRDGAVPHRPLLEPRAATASSGAGAMLDTAVVTVTAPAAASVSASISLPA